MSDWKHGDADRRSNQPEQKGFVVRYELLGIISLMVVHLVGASWWASSMATDVKYMRQDIFKMSEQLESASSDRYRGADAAKDFATVNARIANVEASLKNVIDRGSPITDRRLSVIEQQLFGKSYSSGAVESK